MYLKYSEEELRKKVIICKNCEAADWRVIGRKWSVEVTCDYCGAERNSTISEFYGNGTVD